MSLEDWLASLPADEATAWRTAIKYADRFYLGISNEQMPPYRDPYQEHRTHHGRV